MIKFNNYQSNDHVEDQVEEQVEDQNNALKNEAVGANQREPQTRSSETFLLVCALAAIWIFPFIRAAEAGGLGGFVMTWVGIISTVFGALVFYFPLRLLVRHSLDEEKKAVPRIIILLIFGAILACSIPNLTPGYIKDMEFAAQEYYHSNPQEFSEATEGKTIEINSLSGPYITYFVYTILDVPERQKGGTVIDFGNGWYFVGIFKPI